MKSSKLSFHLLESINKNENLPFFRFKQFDDEQYLLTNEVGEYVFLKNNDFVNYTQNKIKLNHPKYAELEQKSFIKTVDYNQVLTNKYKQKYSYLQWSTTLHIMVLTLRCNHKCLYCHASAGHENDTSLDMTIETAKQVIDTIFSSPSEYLTIEFQGGEPVLNWATLEFSVNYINEKIKAANKKVRITLVSNFSVLDETKAKFIIDNKIGLSTSLDGPEEIHNQNRLLLKNNSYTETVKWIKFFFTELKALEEEYKKQEIALILPGALTTVTRQVLSKPKELVDTYVNLGLNAIALRIMNPIGFGQKTWEKIGYSVDEYIEFYKQAMDYIIELNLQGTKIREVVTMTKLGRILKTTDPAYTDDRTPCGGGIGQIAYDYNGDVYTCDEGRMIGRMGDDLFKMGNVFENSWLELIDSMSCKSICSFSTAEGYPGLINHVYKPYMGICPAYNYATSNQLRPNFYSSEYFDRHEKILDYLFTKMQNEKILEIFKSWL